MSEQIYVPVTVHAGGVARHDAPVEVALGSEAVPFISPHSSLRLVEIDGAGTSSGPSLSFQLDADDGGAVILTFLLSGKTPADEVRHYRLYLDDGASPGSETKPLVTVTDDVMHEEQQSFHIKTPAATYLYHKLGAGFASMIDPDGADWLSYHPWGGSDGVYRGIPNLAYPESNFHPGNTESTSRIVAAGPLKATIQSETNDGQWACQWDIFPRFARLTVLRVGHPYWFLYEGTPGGELDEVDDYIVRSPGIRTTAAERWDERLPTPRWIYFGASNSNRVLYLIHHNDDGETDSYWPMEQNMTVFGFGRLGLDSTLVQTPARFTIGFADGFLGPHRDDTVMATIRSSQVDVCVDVGKPIW